LQQKLKFKTEDASVHLKTLSGLFSNMDTIANLLTASLLMEPFFLIFMYWKITELEKKYASALEEWLDVIGEFEMLNSLANFAYKYRVCIPP
jgi:hypothetical protein